MSHRTATLALIGVAATALVSTAAGAAAAPSGAQASNCIKVFAPPSNVNPGAAPFGVVAGPNGSTYYGDGQTINIIKSGHTTSYAVPDPDTASVGWLTWGGGSRVWFADRGNGRLGTITFTGGVHEWQIPAGANGAAVPQAIVLGPGRIVWFTDQANDRLGRLVLDTGRFHFYKVPSAFPLGLVRGGDGQLYFTERSVDKVARFNPHTKLFTEWTLPTGAFPNRLAVASDGTVWFTSLLTPSAVWHITRGGYLREYPKNGGPVGITFARGHLWTAQFMSGQVDELNLHGAAVKTVTLPDAANAGPLQIAASNGYIWTTGNANVYRINPNC